VGQETLKCILFFIKSSGTFSVGIAFYPLLCNLFSKRVKKLNMSKLIKAREGERLEGFGGKIL
jgi:hypothetical protein